MIYTIVVRQDSDKEAFAFFFPDIRGCFGAADHFADIPKAAQEAFDAHTYERTATQAMDGKPTRSVEEYVENMALPEGNCWMVVDIKDRN